MGKPTDKSSGNGPDWHDIKEALIYVQANYQVSVALDIETISIDGEHGLLLLVSAMHIGPNNHLRNAVGVAEEVGPRSMSELPSKCLHAILQVQELLDYQAALTRGIK